MSLSASGDRAPAKRLEFHFDYSCPYAFLGWTMVRPFASHLGAELVLKPMLLGGVFRSVGTPQNLAATLSPERAKHNGDDLDRWAALFGQEVIWPNAHPQRTVEALRATIVTGCDPNVIDGFFRRYWNDAQPISDDASIAHVVSAAGHDADRVLREISTEVVKNELFALTDLAVQRGVFGAPAYWLSGGPIVWGQDRMPMIAGASFDELAATLRWRKPSLGSGPPAAIDAFWDYSSPFAYLGMTQAERFAKSANVKLRSKPILLGGLFRSLGQVDVPIASFSAAKREFVLRDLESWAKRWNVPFAFPAHFPLRSVLPLRVTLALPGERRDAFRDAAFRAYWAEGRDLSSEAVVAELVGRDAADVLAKAGTDEIKAALRANTDEARERGVFGVPTWLTDTGELFWGQDRLELLEWMVHTGQGGGVAF